MRKAAVVIDPWKLDTFKKHLDASKFKYTVEKGTYIVGEGFVTTVIKVTIIDSNDVLALKAVVDAAVDECKKSKH